MCRDHKEKKANDYLTTDTDEAICPRCGSNQFRERDCGPDSYECDKVWTALICVGCKLYFSELSYEWYIDCEDWQEEETSEAFILPSNVPEKGE